MKFDFKNIDLSNYNICPLCNKNNNDCLCNDKYYCPCNIKAKNCKLLDESCLYYKYLKINKNCKCKLKEE